MTQLSFWLGASLLLVCVLAAGAHVRARRRLEQERQHTGRMAALHMATMEALALAIEAKDHTAHNHIRRVQVYAVGLSRALGMPEDEIEGVRTAALLHDIGKLAVPEHILAKPGPLSPEEFRKVKVHPEIGARIIEGVPFPYPVASLIHRHHEKWNGGGYPSGLAGEAIPLGARVLGLVEYYDALTSDRPYHKAISVDAAAALLRQESGHALDPRVVETFLRILPDLRVEAETVDREAPSFSLTFRDPEAATGTALERLDRSPQAVFDDIAVAHREIHALYEISQTMGRSLRLADTMALITPRLTALVPFSTCAVFLYSEETDSLGCRYATGVDSEIIHQVALKSGEGLVGWVARNKRPLVNARPAADLEAAGSRLQTSLQSALVCPLIVGDRLTGVLAVYHTAPTVYRDDHRRLLDRICEQASAVIHNAVLHERTYESSVTDPLTKLPNTRSMELHLDRELARARRLESEVSVVVMDLNDFKEINDTYGHPTGDRALRQVAQVLRRAIRPYDLCVRYAGDEFVVVLSACSQEEAEHKRQELQRAIEQMAFEPVPGRPITLSISAGTAVFPHDGIDSESLLGAADSRMYHDKGVRRREAARQS